MPAQNILTGDIKKTMRTSLPDGWLFLHGGKIGNSESTALTRANDDTWDLYEMFWNGYPNNVIPVSGGRGTNALSDFQASKTLTLPDFRGRGDVGAGTGPGLTPRPLGAKFGYEKETLTEEHLPVVTLNFTDKNTRYTESGNFDFSASFNDGEYGLDGISSTENTQPQSQSFGGNLPHDIMQPSIAVNIMIKL